MGLVRDATRTLHFLNIRARSGEGTRSDRVNVTRFRYAVKNASGAVCPSHSRDGGAETGQGAGLAEADAALQHVGILIDADAARSASYFAPARASPPVVQGSRQKVPSCVLQEV